MSEHLTIEELHLYADDRVEESDRNRLQTHLRGCARCSAELRMFLRINTVMKEIPLEQVTPHFTRNVIVALGIPSRPPFAYTLVENLAYIFALLIVAGVMMMAFVATGVIRTEHLERTETTAGAVRHFLAQSASAVGVVLNTALQKHFPFLYSEGMPQLLLMLASSLALLIVFDRVLRRKLSVGP